MWDDLINCLCSVCDELGNCIEDVNNNNINPSNTPFPNVPDTDTTAVDLSNIGVTTIVPQRIRLPRYIQVLSLILVTLTILLIYLFYWLHNKRFWYRVYYRNEGTDPFVLYQVLENDINNETINDNGANNNAPEWSLDTYTALAQRIRNTLHKDTYGTIVRNTIIYPRVRTSWTIFFRRHQIHFLQQLRTMEQQIYHSYRNATTEIDNHTVVPVEEQIAKIIGILNTLFRIHRALNPPTPTPTTGRGTVDTTNTNSIPTMETVFPEHLQTIATLNRLLDYMWNSIYRGAYGIAYNWPPLPIESNETMYANQVTDATNVEEGSRQIRQGPNLSNTDQLTYTRWCYHLIKRYSLGTNNDSMNRLTLKITNNIHSIERLIDYEQQIQKFIDEFTHLRHELDTVIETPEDYTNIHTFGSTDAPILITNGPSSTALVPSSHSPTSVSSSLPSFSVPRKETKFTTIMNQLQDTVNRFKTLKTRLDGDYAVLSRIPKSVYEQSKRLSDESEALLKNRKDLLNSLIEKAKFNFLRNAPVVKNEMQLLSSGEEPRLLTNGNTDVNGRSPHRNHNLNNSSSPSASTTTVEILDDDGSLISVPVVPVADRSLPSPSSSSHSVHAPSAILSANPASATNRELICVMLGVSPDVANQLLYQQYMIKLSQEESFKHSQRQVDRLVDALNWNNDSVLQAFNNATDQQIRAYRDEAHNAETAREDLFRRQLKLQSEAESIQLFEQEKEIHNQITQGYWKLYVENLTLAFSSMGVVILLHVWQTLFPLFMQIYNFYPWHCGKPVNDNGGMDTEPPRDSGGSSSVPFPAATDRSTSSSTDTPSSSWSIFGWVSSFTSPLRSLVPISSDSLTNLFPSLTNGITVLQCKGKWVYSISVTILVLIGLGLVSKFIPHRYIPLAIIFLGLVWYSWTALAGMLDRLGPCSIVLFGIYTFVYVYRIYRSKQSSMVRSRELIANERYEYLLRVSNVRKNDTNVRTNVAAPPPVNDRLLIEDLPFDNGTLDVPFFSLQNQRQRFHYYFTTYLSSPLSHGIGNALYRFFTHPFFINHLLVILCGLYFGFIVRQGAQPSDGTNNDYDFDLTILPDHEDFFHEESLIPTETGTEYYYRLFIVPAFTMFRFVWNLLTFFW